MPPEAIRALLADDETHVRQHLRRQLRQLWPELVICAEAGDGAGALARIEAERPDIVFLDIRMPGLDGLQVAERLTPGCQVVFVTAHDEFAVKAFEQAAVDYILKPVSDERLQKTIERVRVRMQSAAADPATLLRRLSASLAPAATPHLRWIKAAKQDEIRIVSVDEVLYFEADDKYTTVVTAREQLLIRKPVKELEQELDPENFWRIHRALIINVVHIDRTHRDFRGRLLLRLRGCERDLHVSRSFAHRFRQM